MNVKKSRKDNRQNLLASSAIPQMSGKGVKSENDLRCQLMCCQDQFGRKNNRNHYGSNDHHEKRRQSIRFETKGIVVLTGFEEPVVANIYDIAPGGVSFVHADKKNINNVDLKMEILIYDSHTDFDYFIGQISGRGKFMELVSDPINKLPVWRYGVEFSDIDSPQHSRLQTCYSLMSYRRFVAQQAVMDNSK
ncbi:PilZ domain-containing protein [Desulforhopalus sp. IMCC35007]|uniref:PilZ domain-containing protein n=1 Tax=Desulforhopalus sp. IMCC35007 TaxID=2569543 RepID=UPI0010AE6531|nr:PilZ domain-containing protein [Desulforhopalus sp. IMCC35007]TKB06361.1 PilZ domain-containing protein [Desulforhopalus sp. IMCC35007]